MQIFMQWFDNTDVIMQIQILTCTETPETSNISTNMDLTYLDSKHYLDQSIKYSC